MQIEVHPLDHKASPNHRCPEDESTSDLTYVIVVCDTFLMVTLPTKPKSWT